MRILKIKRLMKKYPNFSLDITDFELNGGEINLIFGPNGAGKTTFFYSLLHLKRSKLYDVQYIGRNEQFCDINEIKRKLMFIPEENLIFEEITGEKYMKFYLNAFGIKYDRDDIISLLEYWGMKSHDLKKRIKNYSKGMKKKFFIILNILRDPDIIIMDEFVSSLDAWSIDKLKRYLLQEKEKGKIIIVSTHIIDVIENFGDKIAMIKDGKIVLYKEIKSLKNGNDNLHEYLLSF